MRRVVVANQKGGVGKTACSVNISVGLARRGRNVLLCDLDPQAHATHHLGMARTKGPTVAAVFRGEVTPAKALVHIEPCLDLLPAALGLTMVDQWLSSQVRRETFLARNLAGLEGYDFVILDTAPSFSRINRNALFYAREVWIPCSPDPFSLRGIELLERSLERMSATTGWVLPVTVIIPTLWNDRTRRAKAAMERLKESHEDIIAPRIRMNTKIAEASEHGSIFDHDRGRGSEDFNRLCDFILTTTPPEPLSHRRGLLQKNLSKSLRDIDESTDRLL